MTSISYIVLKIQTKFIFFVYNTINKLTLLTVGTIRRNNHTFGFGFVAWTKDAHCRRRFTLSYISCLGIGIRNVTVIPAAEPRSIEHRFARVKFVALYACTEITRRAGAFQHVVGGLEYGTSFVSEGLINGCASQLAGLANVNLNHFRETNGLEFVCQRGFARRIDHAQLHGRVVRTCVNQDYGLASGVQIELRLFGADQWGQIAAGLFARHTGHRLACFVHGLQQRVSIEGGGGHEQYFLLHTNWTQLTVPAFNWLSADVASLVRGTSMACKPAAVLPEAYSERACRSLSSSCCCANSRLDQGLSLLLLLVVALVFPEPTSADFKLLKLTSLYI